MCCCRCCCWWHISICCHWLNWWYCCKAKLWSSLVLWSGSWVKYAPLCRRLCSSAHLASCMNWVWAGLNCLLWSSGRILSLLIFFSHFGFNFSFWDASNCSTKMICLSEHHLLHLRWENLPLVLKSYLLDSNLTRYSSFWVDLVYLPHYLDKESAFPILLLQGADADSETIRSCNFEVSQLPLSRKPLSGNLLDHL